MCLKVRKKRDFLSVMLSNRTKNKQTDKFNEKIIFCKKDLKKFNDTFTRSCATEIKQKSVEYLLSNKKNKLGQFLLN